MKKYLSIILTSHLFLTYYNLPGMISSLVCFLSFYYSDYFYFVYFVSRCFILVDVIGHLVQRDTLKEHERNEKQTKYIQFTLEDLRYVFFLYFTCVSIKSVHSCVTSLLFQPFSLNRLQGTFWGVYADELNDNLQNYCSSNPPVLVIQLCKLRRFLGKYVFICLVLLAYCYSAFRIYNIRFCISLFVCRHVGTVGISNTFHSTKVFFNYNIPEIADILRGN